MWRFNALLSFRWHRELKAGAFSKITASGLNGGLLHRNGVASPKTHEIIDFLLLLLLFLPAGRNAHGLQLGMTLSQQFDKIAWNRNRVTVYDDKPFSLISILIY